MTPDVFGPKVWFLLHTMAVNYPDYPSPAIIAETKMAIIGLPSLLPCNVCKNGIRGWIAKSAPLDHATSSRINLISFILEMHNHVNKKLGKSMWTLSQLLEKYPME